MPKTDRAAIAAQIAALTAQLNQDETGVHQDPGTGRWYIRMKVNGSWTTRRTAPDGSALLSRDQALIAKGLWEAMVDRGEVTRGRETFAELWPVYERHRRADMVHGSWVDLRAHGKHRLLPFINDRRVSKIDVPFVEELRAEWYERVEAGDWAKKTINNARMALMGFCKWAVRSHAMAFNPVPDVAPLQIDKVERDYLRMHEINPYFDGCAIFYRPLARFLVGSGCRISEAIVVRIEDVDWHTGSVKIHKQRGSGGTGDTLKLVSTKGRNFRSVALGPELIEALRDMLAMRAELGLHDGGWLFLVPPSKRGRYAGRTEPRPPHRKTVHDWHEAALIDAGLRDLPLHGLRHTAAAAWLGTGRSLEFARAQLGHSSVKVTSDYYGHLEDQFRAEGAADTEARIRDARSLGLMPA